MNQRKAVQFFVGLLFFYCGVIAAKGERTFLYGRLRKAVERNKEKYACIGFQSCKKNINEKPVEAAQVRAEKPINVQGYKALYQQDTIELKINTLKNGKITGIQLR